MSSPQSRKRKKYFAIAAALVIAAGGGYWFVQKNKATKAEDKPLLAKVEMGSIENTIAAAGTLKPSKFVDVGAQVSGQLQKLHVEVGDVVKQGQLLAEIDARVQEAKVTASRASIGAQEATLEARRAALDLAKANAARQQRLRDANATSQLDYDNAMNNLASAQSSLDQLQKQIEQSKATLKTDETQLEFTKIYAPIAGTIVKIEMSEGRTLNAVQMAPTILRIADLTTMTVESDISEADVSNVVKDMTVYFTTLGSGDRRWYSKVRQVLPSPEVTNNVVLYTGLFDVDNADNALYSEMTAQVFFVTASAQNVMTVPVGALKFGPPRGAPGAGGPAANAQTGRPANASGQAAGAAQAAAGGEAQAGSAGGPPGGFRGQGGAGGPPPGFTPGQGRPPGGFGGGNGQGRRGGFPGIANVNPNAPRPATVTVVKEDGTQEERQIMVGVSSRVSAEVISGLSVGEQVVAGIIQANATTTANTNSNQQNNNRGGFGGGGFPGGGFPGGGFPGGGRF